MELLSVLSGEADAPTQPLVLPGTVDARTGKDKTRRRSWRVAAKRVRHVRPSRPVEAETRAVSGNARRPRDVAAAEGDAESPSLRATSPRSAFAASAAPVSPVQTRLAAIESRRAAEPPSLRAASTRSAFAAAAAPVAPMQARPAAIASRRGDGLTAAVPTSEAATRATATARAVPRITPTAAAGSPTARMPIAGTASGSAHFGASPYGGLTTEQFTPSASPSRPIAEAAGKTQ